MPDRPARCSASRPSSSCAAIRSPAGRPGAGRSSRCRGQGSRLLPVEIKSAKTFSAHFPKGLARFGGLVGERARDGVLVFDGEDRGTVRGVRPMGFDEIDRCPNPGFDG